MLAAQHFVAQHRKLLTLGQELSENWAVFVNFKISPVLNAPQFFKFPNHRLAPSAVASLLRKHAPVRYRSGLCDNV